MAGNARPAAGVRDRGIGLLGLEHGDLEAIPLARHEMDASPRAAKGGSSVPMGASGPPTHGRRAYRRLLPDPLELPAVRWLGVAEKVFGPDHTGRCISEVEVVISRWGYSSSRRRDLRSLAGEPLIRCGHADLGRIADIDLAAWRQAEPQTRRGLINYLLSRALAKLAVVLDAIEMEPPGRAMAVKEAAERDVPGE